MATQEHTTPRPRTPGQIEMERLQDRVDRLQHYQGTHMDLEGPVMNARFMADLAMQWWEHVRQDREAFARAANSEPFFSERDLSIASFAFGDLWTRLQAIDQRMAQTEDTA